MRNTEKPRILAIIPARGGSKGIPRKNIRPLAGKPLLHYMLTAALGSTHLSRVVVSSEDDEVLDAARSIGGETVVLKRPAHLAEDDSPDVPMLQHAVSEIEKQTGEQFDYVVQLHATSPFFEPHHIDEALETLLKDPHADSVVSVYRIVNMHPKKLKRIKDGRLYPYAPEYDEDIQVTHRRHDTEPVYKRNAGLYAAKRHVVMDLGAVWGPHCLAYEMPVEQSLDIDEPHDFTVAELLMKNKGGNDRIS